MAPLWKILHTLLYAFDSLSFQSPHAHILWLLVTACPVVDLLFVLVAFYFRKTLLEIPLTIRFTSVEDGSTSYSFRFRENLRLSYVLLTVALINGQRPIMP